MSIDDTTSYAPSPIIPVTDERINAPADTPKEQQHKIAAYNELLEEIYLRKTELESLEGRLAAMKIEIEDDIAHIARKNSEETTKAEKRRSGTTAVAAFVPSSTPSTPTNGAESNGDAVAKVSANPNAAANGVAAAIANLKNVAGATKNAKSRGKGKGRQEKAKLNGTDLKYKKGGKINLDAGDYDYDDHEVDNEGEYEEEEGSDQEYREREVELGEKVSFVPVTVN
ncbi:hypothetical protein P691DRAFT_773224 [Macrolepiota fuliginosa MF-IS2]|uniref:Uncharacterized protein n=1 Tax=Macrolepiota fuliginosa MF-IS2 TaxID=1400762 RepID=A0A9P5XH68_9AGAR|nr:hypothetical protein P691DRAFT_773224 [Macrolepiota fuliginosa MF-IS2]